MQGFVDFLRGLGAARLAAMGAVTIAMVGFFAILILRMTAPQMTLLFADLTAEDSSGIVKELERQAIPYEIRADGSSVFVPKDKVARLRLRLAETGLPKGGGVGYEIFDKSDVLGATSFVQNINHLRALEGELARTIRAIERVQSARVHLVLPERLIFARERAEPSASIVLRVRGALEAQQVRAIRHLVAAAVNGLKPERVSIVDEAGRLLATGAGDETAGVGLAALERQAGFEKRVKDQIESIVSSAVGPGRARVQVAAEFELNRVTETSDRFDPEGRVIRSSQNREEQSSTGDREAQVSVGNELPSANAGQGGAASRDQSKKTEEVVNYEISRTTKTEVIEPGRIKRLSVAVLVDGVYAVNDKGEQVYQPRAKEELDRIAALVRTGIGFDNKRGDQIEVVNLRFAESPVPVAGEQPGWFASLQPTKDDIMRGIELGVMALLALIVMLLVVRPLVRRIVTPDARATPASGNAALAAASAAGALPAPEGAQAVPALAAAEPQTSMLASSNTAALIDIAQVQGQVHAQSLQKVAELAERSPNETATIIRQWLQEAPA